MINNLETYRRCFWLEKFINFLKKYLEYLIILIRQSI